MRVSIVIKRILAIDIGNTAATVGFYQAGRLLDFRSLDYNAVPKYVQKCIRSGKYNYLDVIISSVNPKISLFIIRSIKGLSGIRCGSAGLEFPVKINHNYNKINKLGIDRKVNIYGASKIYRLPLLIIDYGTAITLDYIDSKGIFRGGMIIPGPGLAFKALSHRAALLPKTLPFPRKAKSFLGRNPRSCMESGILEGYGAMTDELIRRFRKRYGKNLRVLATGGLAEIIRPYTQLIDTVDPKHSVKSLLLIWREAAKNSK